MNSDNSGPGWLGNNHKGDFTSFYQMIKEARAVRAWIYQISTKKWYTPEELQAWVNEQESRQYSSSSKTEDFRIMNPDRGLQDRISFAKRVTDELAEFNGRINKYFKK